MTASEKSPEIGREITAAGYRTNVHDHGGDNGKSDVPVMMIHGSGPGVTAWANWRLVIPELAKHRRVVAPDMLGHGFSACPDSSKAYTFSRLFKDVLAIFDAYVPEERWAVVFGHSYGCSFYTHNKLY